MPIIYDTTARLEVPPIVIRLNGTNAGEALYILKEFADFHPGYDITCTQDFSKAIELTIAKAKKNEFKSVHL